MQCEGKNKLHQVLRGTIRTSFAKPWAGEIQIGDLEGSFDYGATGILVQLRSLFSHWRGYLDQNFDWPRGNGRAMRLSYLIFATGALNLARAFEESGSKRA